VRLHSIEVPDEPLAELCRRYGVARLALLGSILREDFDPDSDLYMLVEFPPGKTPSLLDLGGMLMELRDLLGREIDLKTLSFLSRYFRDEVVRGARTVYMPRRSERAKLNDRSVMSTRSTRRGRPRGCACGGTLRHETPSIRCTALPRAPRRLL
jgi:predicted nucleotidyltransferase